MNHESVSVVSAFSMFVIECHLRFFAVLFCYCHLWSSSICLIRRKDAIRGKRKSTYIHWGPNLIFSSACIHNYTGNG